MIANIIIINSLLLFTTMINPATVLLIDMLAHSLSSCLAIYRFALLCYLFYSILLYSTSTSDMELASFRNAAYSFVGFISLGGNR